MRREESSFLHYHHVHSDSFPGTRLYRWFSRYTVIQVVFRVLGYTGSFPGTRLYTIQVVFQLNESQVVFLVHDYACSFPGTRLYMQFSGYTVIHAVFRVGYTGFFSGYSVIQSVSQC